MRITLVRWNDAEDYPNTVMSELTLMVPHASYGNCSICGNRPPAWFVDPAVVTGTENIGATPLGSPDACSWCLNDLIETGTLRVMNIDPNSW